MRILSILICLASLTLLSCSDKNSAFTPTNAAPLKISNTGQVTPIKVDYVKGDITRLCAQSLVEFKIQLDQLTKIPSQQRTFENSMLAFEKIMADFNDSVQPLIFMGVVNQDADIRDESTKCESDVGAIGVDVFTRKDLYEVVKSGTPRNELENRLATLTILAFEKNGLMLPEDKLTQVKALNQRLMELSVKFSKNIADDKSFALLNVSELEGLPESFIANLKANANGLYPIRTTEPNYILVTQNAKKSSAREKITLAYSNRAAKENTEILQEAVEIRQKIAVLMGNKNWAEYNIYNRSAKNPEEVWNFLNELKSKLAAKNKSDLNILLKYKKELDPTATEIFQSDINYLSYQIKKRDYNLNNEAIKEYFPVNQVMKGLFDTYSQILGVNFVQVQNAQTWAPDVDLYEVRNKADNQLLAYFYTDFYPRDGKYTHAAAFTLISGRSLGVTYNTPVSAIVANFTKPENNAPALMYHDEVTTVFHEFGHIMHQTLTKAPYASLSGTSVARDFVEAPSQMLENWTWDPAILQNISGSYLDNSKKLPKTLLDQMLAAKNFNSGYFYTRQVMLAVFDMTIHTQPPTDVSETYNKLYEEIIGVRPVSGGHFAAGFGHMMGGYDAGYYGYLWSEVYAEDMFTRFQEKGLLSADVGAEYRRSILEKGNTADALELLKEFQGRDPSYDAFYKKLQIK